MAHQPNVQGIVPQSTTDSMNKVDVVTNELADKVAQLRAVISTRMTDEDVAAVNLFLDQLEAKLKSIATDPTDPIPPAVPVPEFRRK